MTNTEAAAALRRWVEEAHGPWSWPLDGDYAQHIAFVCHRNAAWQGGTPAQWRAFCLAYAEQLDQTP